MNEIGKHFFGIIPDVCKTTGPVQDHWDNGDSINLKNPFINKLIK